MAPSLPQSLCRGFSSSQSLLQTCAEVSAAPKFDHPNSQSHSILRLLLQSLRAHCKATGGPGSIWKYLEALVRATGVSGRFVCSLRTDLHFADVVVNRHVSYPQKQSRIIPEIFFYCTLVSWQHQAWVQAIGQVQACVSIHGCV